ncbi:MAG: efflux RND transporter periplasmic adaptor subunit [Rikenellaceae bacterium]
MNKLKNFSRLSLLTLAALSLGSCSQPQAQMPQKSYKTMKVELSNKSLSNQYSAAIRGHQFVEIRPQVSGIITSIKIQEGAPVKKGQTLFVIDQVPYKAALATAKANVQSAQAQVSTARLNLESRKELFNEGIVAQYDLLTTQNSLLTAEAALAQAEAQLVSAQNNLSYTEVKSPVDGVASMIPYRVGALVSSSIVDPLVSVSDDASIYAYFSMTESQILELTRERGTTDSVISSMPDVQLLLADGSEYHTDGRIDAISGTIDQSTGSVQIRAVFDNSQRILRNGGSARVVIVTDRENVIVIPKGATFELQNKVFVYKVVDGVAKSQIVDVFALSDGNSYIVESGIELGDEIIAEGAGLVREGTPVGGASTAQTSQPEQK